TPRERQTTQGDEKPPPPPSKPQSFPTLTEKLEKLVSVRKSAIWSNGITRVSVGLPPVLVTIGPNVQVILKGGLPLRETAAKTRIPFGVKKPVLVETPII